MITKLDIKDMLSAAKLAGFNEADSNDIELLIWPKGLNTHIPQNLPKFCGAVYAFEYNNEYLKVGKVNENSNARYKHQHYRPTSANSTLAKSLVNCSDYKLNNLNVKDWIKSKTTRYNIIIPSEYGTKFINFVEAFFILKYNPKFEGKR